MHGLIFIYVILKDFMSNCLILYYTKIVLAMLSRHNCCIYSSGEYKNFALSINCSVIVTLSFCFKSYYMLEFLDMHMWV